MSVRAKEEGAIIFRSSRTLVFAACAVLAASGCHKSQPVPASTAATVAQPALTGDGIVTGTVHYPGGQPPRVNIDMGQDPACALSGKTPNLTEQYLVENGGLANVFVYIKSGLGGRVYPTPTTPVVLDQKGCRYEPHVVTVMVGQPLRVENSDMTMHNVHTTPELPDNHSSDITQAPGGKPVDTTFAQAEAMIPVRCNNHPWMEAFVNVAANPFYAITDSQGHYEIHGLPPGTYTLGAVHEKMPEQDVTITVAPQATVRSDFTFVTR
jgi:plastocyanin